ncbi:MAG TPA: low molecular weight phosphotyrosine protein phosphatase [Candidatus Gemmiger stercorigallinarum]|nr:low molecular weight phosphotyrosine protein phosphatase [Candidatus Gemmiger stercorigallinarum]
MTRILFVCLGNICRSPMAEFIFKDLAAKAGRGAEFEAASAGTSSEEYGNPVYPPARRKLAEHDIACAGKTARQLTRADYDRYDLLIGMESRHLAAMRRICGGDPAGKMHRLLDYTARPADIADPWYTGDFDAAWNDIESGCRALLGQLTARR